MAVAEQVGMRNRMRARWKALPERERWGITIGLELLLSSLLWFVDR